jgi:hypothetical protein
MSLVVVGQLNNNSRPWQEDSKDEGRGRGSKSGQCFMIILVELDEIGSLMIHCIDETGSWFTASVKYLQAWPDSDIVI